MRIYALFFKCCNFVIKFEITTFFIKKIMSMEQKELTRVEQICTDVGRRAAVGLKNRPSANSLHPCGW